VFLSGVIFNGGKTGISTSVKFVTAASATCKDVENNIR
jgi:hypothetical protein